MHLAIRISTSEDSIEYVKGIFTRHFPAASYGKIKYAFQTVEKYFQGKMPDYLPIDLVFHDLEHTLRGTVATATFLDGMMNRYPQDLGITAHDFELIIWGILMHDTGYLKKRGDEMGTGAKYTAIHVDRSRDFAAQVLGRESYDQKSIVAVQNMIKCTDLQLDTNTIPFQSDKERQMGYCLGTGDLLGQMADPRYLEKLPYLYREFCEAVEFDPARWKWGMYKNLDELMQKTPSFYRNYVLKTIEKQLGNAHIYTNHPYPGGDNPYLLAIEKNIQQLEASTQKGDGTISSTKLILPS